MSWRLGVGEVMVEVVVAGQTRGLKRRSEW